MLAAARTVIAFGIILQAAGFAKLLVIANYFGAGASLDAYYLGLVIPTFLTGVSGGILQTGIIPVYVRTRERGDATAAHRLGSVTLTWTALVLSAVAVMLTVTSSISVPLLARGVSLDTQQELESAFRLLVWTAPINGVADAAALLLNAEGRFAAAAAAPLLNALVGTIVLVASRGGPVSALVLSLLSGLLAQVLVVLLASRRAGIRLRPHLTLPVIPIYLFRTVALPVLLAMVLANLVPAFVQTVSARAGTGAISAMGYASRLHNSLVQAVVLSVSTVLLPHFARLLAQGKNTELRNTLERVFAATLLFSAAALVVVAAGGPLIVHTLLERGNFNSADAHLVANVWLALTAGLLGATWTIFLTRLFQAQRLVWLVFGLGCLSVVVNVSLAYAFLPLWGVVGVALANSVAYALIMWAGHARANRVLGRVLGVATLGFLARTIVANLAAYFAAVFWTSASAGMNPIATILGQLLLIATANILVARTAPLSVSLAALLRR
jgi:putative peptidoglycan lipid II flippase